MSAISRRQFATLAGAGVFSVRGAEPLTAANAVGRIQVALGGEWPPTGPDGFKAGDPKTVVKGVATTAMATVDVLKQALRANANLILTYEPTFFARADASGGEDPVLRAKREFIEKNGLVVFRLRDHWQARAGDPMVTGLATALGWAERAFSNGVYEIPAATVEAAVAAIRSKLKLGAGLRVVGDRKATVRRVMLVPGSMTPAALWQRFGEVDMIVAGEVREWENTHFAADLVTVGMKCALVTTGRTVSEGPGTRVCADWLKTVVKEVPVRWIGVGDPYWRPA